MTSNFIQELDSFRRSWDERGKELKDSQLVTVKLSEMYRKLDTSERQEVDRALVDWVLSEDENLRFDAMALISEFRIHFASPALHELAGKLSIAREPGAPYELEKVHRLIEKLRFGQ